MTQEEAAEIVLAGGWMPCGRCGGCGSTFVTKTVRGDGRMVCNACKGGGFLPMDGAKEAYALLKLESPPKPYTVREKVAMASADFIQDRLGRNP